MRSQIFINLPLSDPGKSSQLYVKIGFKLNPAFSNDSAKCLVWSEDICHMIMSKERFSSFATKPLTDKKSGLAGIYALYFESVEKMNQISEQAISAAAQEPKALQDHGFMQLRTIEDPYGPVISFSWT